MYQNNMLYTLNLHNAIQQTGLKKAGNRSIQNDFYSPSLNPSNLFKTLLSPNAYILERDHILVYKFINLHTLTLSHQISLIGYVPYELSQSFRPFRSCMG